ncbi:hypothetical protein [Pseudomonas sp. LF242]
MLTFNTLWKTIPKFSETLLHDEPTAPRISVINARSTLACRHGQQCGSLRLGGALFGEMAKAVVDDLANGLLPNG